MSAASGAPIEPRAAFGVRCQGIDNSDDRRQAARDRAAQLGALSLDAKDRLDERDACRRAGLPVAEFDELCPAQSRALRAVSDAQAEHPEREVNVSFRDPYRYSLGGGLWPRGVYEYRQEEGRWQFRSGLPHVLARIVRRDGSQRRIGTDYLLAEHADDAHRVVVTDDEVRDGQWSRKLGVNLSADAYICAAVATAIRDTAHQDAPEREATPRPDVHAESGHVDIPVAECLPPAYLQMPPRVTPADARAALREVAQILARHPKMALTVGASAGAPFVGPLRQQSHWWDLHGDARKGKSTTHAIAAALWGDARLGTGVVLGWDATGPGLGRYLGKLGILPPFLDERGLVKWGPSEWGEQIYATCQGSSRLKAETRGNDIIRTSPWFGTLFSTGNHRLTDGLGSGRFAGIPARVIELETPFTESAAEAKHLTDDLLPRCYGWLGPRILDTFTVPTVRELVMAAAATVGTPDGGIPGTIAEYLHLAVAGAMMIDAELGTGSAVADAAAEAARDYLDAHGHEPEHDADRMLDALAESLAARRPAWPTEAEYVELGQPYRSDYGMPGAPVEPSVLARHGHDHESSGIRLDNGHLYVFSRAWRELAAELGVDSSVACAELHRRDVLQVPASSRRKGEWTNRPRVGGKQLARGYVLDVSAIERDDQADDDPAPTGPAPTGPAPTEAEGRPVTSTAPATSSAATSSAEAAAVTLLADQLGAVTVETVETDLPVGPCPVCLAPGQSCGPGGVAAEDQEAPCVACGAPTLVRSACGVPRTGYCAGRQETRQDQEAAAPALAPRGAHPVAVARAQARQEATATKLARLDDPGAPVRFLEDLERPYRPRRRVRGGFMEPATLRPDVNTMPGVTELVRKLSGWAWSRPYDGDTVVLDASGSFISSASTVIVAHGALTHTGVIEWSGLPGYYQATRYPWAETDIPDPLGGADGDTVWITNARMSLLAELVEEGRWPDVAVLDSYTCQTSCRLDKWAQHVNKIRAKAIREYGRDTEVSTRYDDVKVAFSQAVNLMHGEYQPGQPRRWPKCGVHRTDWSQGIKEHAAANLWRRADQCRKLAPGLGPVAVQNTDEIVIPAAALEVVTTRTLPGRDRPPILLDPDGIRLGTFKVKGGA